MIVPRRMIDTLPGELRQGLRSPGVEEDGALVERWEGEFARSVHREFAVAVGSGRQAMQLILSALGLAPGMEVIIPAYTLKDLIPIIRGLGLAPVPADIDPATWNLDAETITPRLTQRTRVILALHLFGEPAPMPEIMAIAKDHGLMVIEDCAHSAGSTIHGRPTGSFGDAAFFSFEAIKPINTYGGGMVVTDDQVLAARVRAAVAGLAPPRLLKKMLAARLERLLFASGLALIPLVLLASERGRGVMTRLYRLIQHPPRQPWGYSPLQARLGLRKLVTLPDRIERRRQQAALLKSLLPASCQPQGGVRGGEGNGYFFVVKVPAGARELRRRLLWHGIDAGHGPELADDCAALLGDRGCPEAADLQARGLHLPLHVGLANRHLERLASLL